jgi:hypothetical protein
VSSEGQQAIGAYQVNGRKQCVGGLAEVSYFQFPV